MPVEKEMAIIEDINLSDKSVMYLGKIGEEIVSNWFIARIYQ